VGPRLPGPQRTTCRTTGQPVRWWAHPSVGPPCLSTPWVIVICQIGMPRSTHNFAVHCHIKHILAAAVKHILAPQQQYAGEARCALGTQIGVRLGCYAELKQGGFFDQRPLYTLCDGYFILYVTYIRPKRPCIVCTPNSQQYKGYTAWQASYEYGTSPSRWAAVVRKLCRGRTSAAYPCREKWPEISRRISDFGLRNVLLTANLCDNPANLWINGAFLGDNRPYDNAGMV
jgi:hypothetical protein